MEMDLGWERRRWRASLGRTARFSGAASFLARWASSAKTTSRTQCNWFSMAQWERTIWRSVLVGAYLARRKYLVKGLSAGSPRPRRQEVILAMAAIPGKA